nr:MAG TPA: hypothetical protein [Caudoviricetes sp.]
MPSCRQSLRSLTSCGELSRLGRMRLLGRRPSR